MKLICRLVLPVILALVVPAVAFADVELCHVFTDHMVLQRNRQNPVWGWDAPGTKVMVTIKDQKHEATADANGRWQVKLDAMKAGGPFVLKVSGSSDVTIQDVLVGEVWVCSGQSNMAFTVGSSTDADLETLTARYPRIRHLRIPNRASQKHEKDFNGAWTVCSPQTVRIYTGVGYFFGLEIHQALGVPVGLINNSWGGSSAEAWVRRDLLEKDERYTELMKRWAGIEKTYDHEKAMAKYAQQLKNWQEAVKKAKAEKKPIPRRPRAPRNPLTGNHRPGNLYGGCLYPVIGYGIRGTIWYQGESNASRAYQYRHLFPLMINNWRQDWKQGDFPFYWVSLADYRREVPEPGESTWAELREAQTMTLSLPHTGEAIITDLGEADDIHPRNKRDVGKRLARLALAQDYGYKIVNRSPRYLSHTIKDGKVIIKFQDVGDGLDTFDVREPIGLAIAGEDRKFVKAQGKILSNDTLLVWSDQVKNPVSVRYAWADNPVCNLQNRTGLPVTPFRTDDWPGLTVNAK